MGGGLLALEEVECQPEGLISRLRGGVQGDCRGGTARRALLPDGVPDLGLAPLPALPTATTCPAAAGCQDAGQPVLDAVPGLLIDQGRHRDGDPLLRRPGTSRGPLAAAGRAAAGLLRLWTRQRPTSRWASSSGSMPTIRTCRRGYRAA